MSIYLSNAFSLQMQGDYECLTAKVSLEKAKELLLRDNNSLCPSCVGHADIAAVLSKIIGHTVPVNRISIALQPGDILVVGQYVGPRLPEGATVLPEGAKIEWYLVMCIVSGCEPVC